ncbi:ethyl acetate hydrolase-like [Littorina saxatilis]|uniref:Alpha/beta hydrolase fold-3 domain-containing protein n=1 Tax=Littorina saxatilis TaxID=31220 RepID=A0AAN9BEX7_9CAEN
MASLEAWGEAGKKYEVHEETLSYFRRSAEISAKTYEEMAPEELRAMSLRKGEVFAGHVDFDGSAKEIIVPATEGNEDGVPVSVYKPRDVSRVPAILVYFHGGGHVTSSRTSYATLLKTLAKRAQCVVVSVEYRLAPEHKLPAGFNDCRDVTRWVLRKKALVGGEEESQVGVGGDSAGGHLASSISHDVKGLAFQLLVYPHTDMTLSTPSYAEFATTPGLSTSTVHWFMDKYLASDAQRTDPVVSPYHRPSFTGLPPALCILAQLDPLRDDGLAYCEKLKKAGVPTEVLMVKGAPHVFFHLPGHFKELTKEPYERSVQFLKKFQPAS